MSWRIWKLHAALVGALALAMTACPGFGGESGTSGVDSGMATTGSGFDTGIDTGLDGGPEEGLDGSGLENCLQYLEACEQDPYCACYIECASEGGKHLDCLARCNLADTPYFADLLLTCLEGEFGSSGE